MSQSTSAEPARLLLVEDDECLAHTLVLMLSKRGIRVRHVATGEQAIELFDPDQFDIVVSDICLGGMSGVQVLQHVRNSHVDFPFILMTAHDTLQTAIDAVRLGAQDYILKPLVEIEMLVGPVNRLVQHRRLQRENRELWERLRHLSSEVLMAEERERRKIADGLHDVVVQTLAVAKVELDRLLEVRLAGASESLQRVSGMLEGVIQQSRTLMFDLSPPILYDLGLDAALDSLVLQLGKESRVAIRYQPCRDAVPVGRDLAVILYRSVRELLLNALKYASAKTITVAVALVDGRVEILVQDDGIGFDAEVVLSSRADRFGYGLFSMRERLWNYGGEMRFLEPGGPGTGIKLVVPVDGSGEQAWRK